MVRRLICVKGPSKRDPLVKCSTISKPPQKTYHLSRTYFLKLKCYFLTVKQKRGCTQRPTPNHLFQQAFYFVLITDLHNPFFRSLRPRFSPISTVAHRLPTFVMAAKTAFQARRFAFFPLIFYEAKSNRKSLCSNGTLKVDAEEICDGMLVACTMRSFSFHFFCVCHFSICLLQFSTQMNKKLHNKDRVRLLFTFIWMLVKK